MNFWDQNYTVAGYKYGTAPNEFLVEQSRLFPKNSTVLLPGDGEGRNSVWLAKQGFKVFSIDSSRIGVQKALELANAEGVSIQTELTDLAEWSPIVDMTDAVVLTYLHLCPSLRTSTHSKISKALKTNGILVLEAFHPNQLGYSSGGPKDEAMLYSLEQIREDFGSELHEIFGCECQIFLEEGPGHQGPAFVTRWVGKKL